MTPRRPHPMRGRAVMRTPKDRAGRRPPALFRPRRPRFHRERGTSPDDRARPPAATAPGPPMPSRPTPGSPFRHPSIANTEPPDDSLTADPMSPTDHRAPRAEHARQIRAGCRVAAAGARRIAATASHASGGAESGRGRAASELSAEGGRRTAPSVRPRGRGSAPMRQRRGSVAWKLGGRQARSSPVSDVDGGVPPGLSGHLPRVPPVRAGMCRVPP